MTTNYMSLYGTPEIPRTKQGTNEKNRGNNGVKDEGGVMRADNFKSVASAAQGRNLHVVMSLPLLTERN